MEPIQCVRACADASQIMRCRCMVSDLGREFGEYSALLSLAGNEARLKILFLLRSEAELCVCDMSDVLEMKIPAVSQHLRKMKDGKIISQRKDGQTIYYFISPVWKSAVESLLALVDKKIKVPVV